MATTTIKKRSGAKKVYNHDVVIGEETVQVKTGCKLFGGMMMENGKIAADCLKCKENAGVQSLCAIATFPEILADKKSAKKGKKAKVEGEKKESKKKGEPSDSLLKIIAFLDTPKSMKQLQEYMGTKTTLYNICNRHSDKIARVGKLFVAVQA